MKRELQIRETEIIYDYLLINKLVIFNCLNKKHLKI